MFLPAAADTAPHCRAGAHCAHTAGVALLKTPFSRSCAQNASSFALLQSGEHLPLSLRLGEWLITFLEERQVLSRRIITIARALADARRIGIGL